MLKNSPENYGWVSIAFHWLVALAIIGLFALGLWMVGLTYYSPWYNTAPDIHRSIGLLLIAVIVARLAWRILNSGPDSLSTHKVWEVRLAHFAHWLLYIVTAVVLVSGYLISTAKGESIDVFNWFGVPALVTGEELGIMNLEDKAGVIHEYLAWALIGLTAVHALAALKHHFIDRDKTMLRMLGKH